MKPRRGWTGMNPVEVTCERRTAWCPPEVGMGSIVGRSTPFDHACRSSVGDPVVGGPTGSRHAWSGARLADA
jgi:hypothetical protein